VDLFVLREAQLAAISDQKIEGFKQRLYQHINNTNGDAVVQLGPAAARETIEYGLERASAYRIAAESEVVAYVALMFQYGRDFDADPALPFADMILEQRMVYEREPTIKRFQKVADELNAAGT
jgi:hypothetical protein